MQKIIEYLAFNLPQAKTLATFAAIAGIGIYLFRIRVATRRWVNVCLRLVGAALVLPLTLSLIVTLLGESRPQIFESPDSQHIAKYTYNAGFLGRDSTFVVLGKRWSIQSETVYEYEGPSDWNGTEIRWLGNNRLLVRYYPDQTRFQQCKTEAEGVAVQCESLRTLEPTTK